MADIWSKLNLKEHSRIAVLDSPSSFESSIDSLAGVDVVRDMESAPELEFLLAFVTRSQEIAAFAESVGTKTKGDAVVWLAYPKKSSRRHTCDFSRDSGWEPLGDAGFEAVRQVAIDEDWSALRFRRVEFIKTLRRDPSRTLSMQGKARSTRS